MSNLYYRSLISYDSLLLDNYGSSVGAYSLRKINSSYSGSCIRVRRSSDNTEQDIGFVNNELDQSSLTSFVGAGNGFIRTWYDQSGSGKDATQTTQANQPRIVLSGVVDTMNSKPTIVCVDNTDFLQFSSNITCTHLSSVAKYNTINTVNYIVSSGSLGFFYGGTAAGVNGIGAFAGVTIASLSGEDTNRHLAWYSLRGGRIYLAKDGSSETNVSAFSASMIVSFISRSSTSGAFIGNIQEVVMWNSDVSSNKTGIETNINSYFSIY